MAKWVELPDDAQVTMSRESWESTGGMGPLGKVGIAVLVVVVLWLMGHAHDAPKADHPKPQSTVSTPAR
jgi:hypothetical protein